MRRTTTGYHIEQQNDTMTLPRTTHNASDVDAKIAKTHPGMRAIAGPFAVNSTTTTIAMSERASCVRSLRDQQKNDPTAKIIVLGRFAWVIRSEAGWLFNDPEKQRARYKGELGIRGGRMLK